MHSDRDRIAGTTANTVSLISTSTHESMNDIVCVLIESNKMSNIPSEIGGLEKLASLDIWHGNQIEQEDLDGDGEQHDHIHPSRVVKADADSHYGHGTELP